MNGETQPDETISTFRNQLHQVSDAFHKLSPEEQSEAVKLIQGLHSTLLNQVYSIVQNHSEIANVELCNHQNLIHDNRIFHPHTSIDCSIDDSNAIGIISQREKVNATEVLENSFSQQTALSLNISAQAETNNSLKVPLEHHLKRIIDENKIQEDFTKINNEINSTKFEDENINSSLSEILNKNSNINPTINKED